MQDCCIKVKGLVIQIKRLLLLLCLCISTALFSEESYCYFVPPKEWEISFPNPKSEHVKICFRKKQEGLCPSINLAIEDVDLSLNEYVKVVQQNHQKKHKTRFRNLGSFLTQAGSGQLIELDLATKWGETRLLQFVFVKNKKAYVLTAGALKEEFPKYYKDIERSLHTFQLTPDLFSSLQPSLQNQIKEAFSSVMQTWQKKQSQIESFEQAFNDPSFQKETWMPFQEKILQCHDLGAFWQVLTLAYVQQSLNESYNSNKEIK